MIPAHPDCFTILPDEARDLGLGTAALRYQRLGYSVLALGYGSKRPHQLFEHGVKWATTDEAMVAWIWRQQRAAGVGIATGAVSRLVVVDLDERHDGSGYAEFEGMRDAWSLPLPDGIPAVATPSGGWHLWFRTPERMAPDGSHWPLPVPGRKGILPHVDVKGDGGYVVAPPSRIWVETSEGRVLLPYRWAGGGCPCSPPMAPPWLIDWITRTPATAIEAGGGGEYGESPDVEQARAAGLRPGERNVMLHRIACSLYRKYGTTPDGLAAAAQVIGEVLSRTSREGGFGGAEIERALKSALAFVRRAEQAEDRRYSEDAPDLDRWRQQAWGTG